MNENQIYKILFCLENEDVHTIRRRFFWNALQNSVLNRTTADGQPQTDNRRRTTADGQPQTVNRRRTTAVGQPFPTQALPA